MTEPHSPAEPLEVIIPDHVMQQLQAAPPEATDQLAAAIAHLREHGPESLGESRELIPHPVDHSPDRPRVHVPATRSISYLRNAVADISPPTVEDFDRELREDTSPSDGRDPITGLRYFIERWVEYIALQGDHDRARHIEQSQNAVEFTSRYSDAMDAVRAENFPDAHDDLSDLSVRVSTDGKQCCAVCPVTMLRVYRATPEEAVPALRAALSEMLTGF